jgi:hypothetical protein
MTDDELNDYLVAKVNEMRRARGESEINVAILKDALELIENMVPISDLSDEEV